MRTLNKDIKLIQTLKEAHGQLASGTFYFGDPWEFCASQNIQYPFLGLRFINSTVEGKIHTRNFNIFLCDRVKKGELNETEVISDLELVMLDLHNQLRLNLEGNDPTTTPPATVTPNPSITPFTERFEDEVSGVEMNIGIIQFNDRQTCNIPT